MTVDKEKGYVVFTEEMKKTHTILVPNMLPMHFKIIGKVMEKVGYRVELLETSGQHIAETRSLSKADRKHARRIRV